MLKLLFGKVTRKRILLITLPGILAGILLFIFHPERNGLTLLTALLTMDLVSGMVSNQLEDTHRAWQKIKPIYAYLFIGFHTIIYPILLFVMEKDYLIFGSLLLILSVKLYGFIRGYFLT